MIDYLRLTSRNNTEGRHCVISFIVVSNKRKLGNEASERQTTADKFVACCLFLVSNVSGFSLLLAYIIEINQIKSMFVRNRNLFQPEFVVEQYHRSIHWRDIRCHTICNSKQVHLDIIWSNWLKSIDKNGGAEVNLYIDRFYRIFLLY